MINTLATIMIEPLVLNRWQQMLLLVPLCLTISIVYKTTKCTNLREILSASVVSWITIIIGMYVVGGLLLLLYELVA